MRDNIRNDRNEDLNPTVQELANQSRSVTLRHFANVANGSATDSPADMVNSMSRRCRLTIETLWPFRPHRLTGTSQRERQSICSFR